MKSLFDVRIVEVDDKDNIIGVIVTENSIIAKDEQQAKNKAIAMNAQALSGKEFAVLASRFPADCCGH